MLGWEEEISGPGGVKFYAAQPEKWIVSCGNANLEV